MNITKKQIRFALQIGSAVLSGVAFIVSVISKSRMDKAVSRYETSVDELISGGVDEIHIAQEVVDDAIRDEVSRKVYSMMPDAMNAGRREATRVFTEEVRKEVQSQYSDISKEVKKEVERQVGRIDPDKLRNDILKEAKDRMVIAVENDVDRVVDEFRDNLSDMLDDLKGEAESDFDERIDELVERFDERVNDVMKIYKSVANRFVERS